MTQVKNYTTKVPASRTIAQLEDTLIRNGARDIMKRADDRQMISEILFTLPVRGELLNFRFTPNVEVIAEKLVAKYNAEHTRTRKKAADFTRDAYNIGWRCKKDIIEVVLTDAEFGGETAHGVMMGFLVQKDGRTMKEVLEKRLEQKQLPEGVEI